MVQLFPGRSFLSLGVCMCLCVVVTEEKKTNANKKVYTIPPEDEFKQHLRLVETFARFHQMLLYASMKDVKQEHRKCLYKHCSVLQLFDALSDRIRARRC